VRRRKSLQAKMSAFFFREGRSFVQPLAIEQIHPAGTSCNSDPLMDSLCVAIFRISSFFSWPLTRF
jgi:hypothetical protein